ncbi:MAG: hypothetical protein KC731_38590, partial [Myxococcales bacterium]|nr:hypothetical protein [Myxococcales bacterium]
MSRAIQHLGRFAVLAVGACAPVALAPDVTPATPQRQATPSAAPSDTPTDATASPWANLMRAKPDPPPSPEPPPPPEPQAAPSIEPPPPSLEPRATSLEIAPGTRCRVDWTSFGLHEEGARILISGIAAIETTGGDGCAKQVFYDEAIERKLSCVGVPDCSVELLEGGALYPAGSPDDPEGIVFRDLDFDG